MLYGECLLDDHSFFRVKPVQSHQHTADCIFYTQSEIRCFASCFTVNLNLFVGTPTSKEISVK